MKNSVFAWRSIGVGGIVCAVLFFHSAFGADGTQVHIRIEGSNTTVFDGNVSVSSCTVTDTDGVEHSYTGMAICALKSAAEQAGVPLELQNAGFGLFLKRVGTDDTPSDFSLSWGFWVNDDLAPAGVDTTTVQESDNILLTFSGFPAVPLRIIPPITLTENSDAEFTIEKRVGDFASDFTWHGSWQPADGATLHVENTTFSVPINGRVTVALPATPSVHISADGTGFVRSSVRTLPITVASPSPTATPAPSISPSPTPTASPTSAPSPTPTPSTSRGTQANKALSYLRDKQDDDGSIDGSTVSGWSAIAFGAHGERANEIKNSGDSLLDALARTSVTSATDIERHILALRAGGVNPRSFTGTDYVAKLRGQFHDNQIGEPSLTNDDIFGILALLASGDAATSTPVNATVRTVLAHQKNDGSWDNVDVTSAAIEALRAYKAEGGKEAVDDAVQEARSYLKNHRDQFGGFGENSATTSWAIQAIVALNEDPADWKTADGDTPWDALLRYQNGNGGFGWKSANDVSSFMTAYAIPALLLKPLPITNLPTETITDNDNTRKEATGTDSSPTPRIAGASTKKKTTTPATQISSLPTIRSVLQRAYVNTPSPSATPSSLPFPAVWGTETSITSPVPLSPVDRRFALMLFSLANIGVGVTCARIVTKRRENSLLR